MKTEKALAAIAVMFIVSMTSLVSVLAKQNTVKRPLSEQLIAAGIQSETVPVTWESVTWERPRVRTISPVFMEQLKVATFDQDQKVVLPAGCGFQREITADGNENYIDLASGDRYDQDGILIQ